MMIKPEEQVQVKCSGLAGGNPRGSTSFTLYGTCDHKKVSDRLRRDVDENVITQCARPRAGVCWDVTSDNPNLLKSVDELELSTRPLDVLRRAGLDTIGDLVKESQQELLRWKGLGSVGLREIKDQLRKHGLTLHKARSEEEVQQRLRWAVEEDQKRKSRRDKAHS